MEFRENEAIYLQIAAYVSEQILLRKWQAEGKIPSVRELAIELQVNPNTVLRAYEFLQGQEVIYNKRGLGFFVAADGEQKVKAYRKERFYQTELPSFFKTISQLGISMADIEKKYEQFQPNNSPKPNTGNENK